MVGCFVFDFVGDKVGKVCDVLVVYCKIESLMVVGLIVEILGKCCVFFFIGCVMSIGVG